MSDKQKTTQENCCAPSEGMPFAAMMEKMMGQQGQGCGCIAPGVMSQMMEQSGEMCSCMEMKPNDTDQAETSSECSSMMSQMMDVCCGPQVETGTGTRTA